MILGGSCQSPNGRTGGAAVAGGSQGTGAFRGPSSMRAVVCMLLVAAIGVVVAPNACRDTASCCQTFAFFRPSAWDAAPYGDVTTVSVTAGVDGPWAPQGIALSVDQTSSLSGAPYPLGLVNTSKPAGGPVGADRLYRAGTNLSLAAFEYYPTTLLRYSSTLRWRINKQPACVASVTTLRSIDFNHRQSVRLTSYRLDALSGTMAQVAQTGTTWAVSDSRTDNTYELTTLHVDELKIEFYGQGYGALSSIEVCYHAPLAVDRCGVCAGPGVGCDVVGGACTTGMSGACAAGTFNASMACVPNLAGAAEICNGIDDNCDGFIDNADWGTISCGTGACRRTYLTCIGGAINSRCQPGSPTVETCNGIDDDCDGVVDNGGVCGSSAEPTPTVTATFVPSPSSSEIPSATPTRTAAPSTSAVPTPSRGATRSLSPSATVSASMAPTPSPAPIGGAGLLVPLATCVRPLDTTPGQWQALFGYALSGGNGSALMLGVDPATNWLTSAWLANQPQPTHFQPNTQAPRMFEVVFAAGAEVQWRLCVDGACRTAIATTASPRCDATAPTAEAVQPVAVGCVSRMAGVCTATWGYVNPNAFTVEMTAGVAGLNAFAPAPADRRQPRVFWPGYVANAFTTTFDCATADWTLAWTLGGAVISRTAADLC